MHTLFYSPLCPDCPAFMAELDKQSISYEPIDITASMSNLKRFLRLRDDHVAFDEIKKWGFVGVPLLVTKDGKFIFDLSDLMGTTCSPTQFEK